MYCIKVNADVENYVCSCDNGSFRLCGRKCDAKKFASLRELLADAVSAGLHEEDFEVVRMNDNDGEESAVFAAAEKDVITFERLAEICESCTAMSKLNLGDKVENGYIVVAVKPDSVKIWSLKNSIGNMSWDAANASARKYADVWNNYYRLPVVASRSELLSKSELETMFKSVGETGFIYWTSTEFSSGFHWRVCSGGSLNNTIAGDKGVCCPGIWVVSRESSKGSSENKDTITFRRLHEICEEGSADLVLRPGDKVEQDYVVIAVKPDSVKVWSPKNFLGNMDWQEAKQVADTYYREWNNSYLPVGAISSELLSKEEAESLSQGDRTTGFHYWTSTENSSGRHWFVNSGGSLTYAADSYSFGCCPGIWVK